MGQKARWVLPSVVNPPLQKCYQVTVPDDPAHIAAFFGAMYALTKPYNWQNDLAHTAIDVGAVWDDLYQQIALVQCGSGIFPIACPMDLVVGQGSWTLNQPYEGAWLPGGFVNRPFYDGGVSYDAIFINLALPAGANFSYIEVYFDLFKGAGTRVNYGGVYVFNGGGLVTACSQEWHLYGDGFNQTLRCDLPVPAPATKICVQMRADEYDGNVPTDGTLRIFGTMVGLTGGVPCP